MILFPNLFNFFWKIVINSEVIVLYFIKNHVAKIIYNRTYKIYNFNRGVINIIIHIR